MKSKAFSFGARRAFTIVELGVVIVILSILLSFVMVSRSIIDHARAGKLRQESLAFMQYIRMFRITHDCFPGDCTSILIQDLRNVPTACMAEQAGGNDNDAKIALGTGLVETAAKRSCAMMELQQAGYIDSMQGVNSSLAISALAGSLPSKNTAPARAIKSAFWDLRSVTGDAIESTSGKKHMPVIAGSNAQNDAYDLSQWRDRNMLILVGGSGNTAFAGDAIDGTLRHALSPKLAKKLDDKFDTGKPYSGVIIASAIVMQPDKCVTATASTAEGATVAAPEYRDTSAESCIMAFLLPED